MLSGISICYLRIVFEVLQRVTENHRSIAPTLQADTRLAAMNDWIAGIDAIAGSERRRPRRIDASFRRYFRLRSGADSFIVMDAPPEQEDCLPFVRIAGYLEAMDLNAPRIIEANLDEGFLLLSDLGNASLSRSVAGESARRAPTLYADAIAALLAMQRHGAAFQVSLPPYDITLLRFELSLFHDWLCGHTRH